MRILAEILRVMTHIRNISPSDSGCSVSTLGAGAVTNTSCINTMRPIQNGRHFADDTFKHIFLKKNVEISIKISLEFVPKGPINNIPALVQIIGRRQAII